MSYSVWMEADLGGPEPIAIEPSGWWNYTSNVAPMWRLAMPDTDGIAGMDGMLVKDAAESLRSGIAQMEKDPERFRELNPENGWGDFDRQLEALRQLLADFEKAPQAKVVVSR